MTGSNEARKVVAALACAPLDQYGRPTGASLAELLITHLDRRAATLPVQPKKGTGESNS